MFGLENGVAREAIRKADDAMLKVTESITLTRSHIEECNRKNVEVTNTLADIQKSMSAGFAEIRTSIGGGRKASFGILMSGGGTLILVLLGTIGFLLARYALK